ncbi:hypothetical protein FB45DRAFT_872200 [Roridomyces roridus]|uniref:Uncharacterized protein n=1 Tax=Roridomyces roridus TaxID=1738132 RepID=A0AAD7FFQ9_9AGAR|nr:hypothetical protein FB45DRAFT_872200 [Roridomyces roridus]
MCQHFVRCSAYVDESTLQDLHNLSPPTLAFKVVSYITCQSLWGSTEVGWWLGSFSRLTIALRPGDQRFRKLNLPLLFHPQTNICGCPSVLFDLQTQTKRRTRLAESSPEACKYLLPVVERGLLDIYDSFGVEIPGGGAGASTVLPWFMMEFVGDNHRTKRLQALLRLGMQGKLAQFGIKDGTSEEKERRENEYLPKCDTQQKGGQLESVIGERRMASSIGREDSAQSIEQIHETRSNRKIEKSANASESARQLWRQWMPFLR